MSDSNNQKVELFKYLIEKLKEEGCFIQGFPVDNAVEKYKEGTTDFDINIIEISEGRFRVLTGKYRDIEGDYTFDKKGNIEKCEPEKNKNGEDR